MTTTIYCQCSRVKFQLEFSTGALEMTVNQCYHSQSSCGKVHFKILKATGLVVGAGYKQFLV